MAIREISIASFGPFEYDDADPDTPYAVRTTGDVKTDGTLEGSRLRADELITNLRVKAGGAILNDNDTFELTDTGFRLKDTTGQFIVEFTVANLEIKDLINGLFCAINSSRFSANLPSAGNLVEVGVDDTLGFLYISFLDAGGNPLRLLGGAYRVHDTTETTGAATGAFQVAGGVRVDKSVSIGDNLTYEGSEFAKGIKVVSQVELTATYNIEAGYRVFLVDDGTVTGGTMVLPAATGSGRIITIKDASGTFDTANVLLDASGTDVVDNNGNFTLDLFKQSITLIDGLSGQWFILNNVGF